MEYLMTYGWAILIIAVVLGALFGLGFFSSTNLAPKITAGSCQVYRPDGPGTTSFINVEGTCNNELPQYVGQFSGATGNSNVMATGLIGVNPVGTVTFWMNLKNTVNNPVAIAFSASNTIGASFGGNFGACAAAGCASGAYGQVASSLTNTWTFVAVSFTGVTAGTNVYINGVQESLGTQVALAPGATIDIGNTGSGNAFNGLLSNVQYYNVSLNANQIVALYDEGLGGVPIKPAALIGWWPLNGNGNDYSGNQNNGAPVNVVYTSSWSSGYTSP
jgi:hypothetical protein